MSRRIREVVVDTSVFVAAAFRPGSDSGRIVRALSEGRLTLVWDDATRRETERIMRKIPPVSWDAVAGLFRKEGLRPHREDPSDHVSVQDPDDRKFAALAASSGATLVSLDRHLLDAPVSDRYEAVSPTRFLRAAGLDDRPDH